MKRRSKKLIKEINTFLTGNLKKPKNLELKIDSSNAKKITCLVEGRERGYIDIKGKDFKKRYLKAGNIAKEVCSYFTNKGDSCYTTIANPNQFLSCQVKVSYFLVIKNFKYFGHLINL